jgi:anti-sigma factor RsiW
MYQCELPAKQLVEYQEGELRGARREWVEAHIQVCPACRARLDALEHVDRVLRARATPVDDPAGRALVRAGIEREAARQARRRAWAEGGWSTTRNSVRQPTILAPLALLCIVALWPAPIDAVSSLGWAVIDLAQQVRYALFPA